MNDTQVMQQQAARDAYYVIDRFLRNYLYDEDYEEYSAALDSIMPAPAPQPAEPVDRIHSCSYFCDRPACIKAQRKYLAQQNAELILLLESINRMCRK